MKIDAFKINNTDNFAFKSYMIKGHGTFFINGKEFTAGEKDLIVFSKEDCLQYKNYGKNLIDYRRGDEIISIEQHRSKPQYHSEDSSDEDILRAIANRKELAGFEAYYEEYEPEDVELNIIGNIGDTGSDFIYSSVMGQYSKTPAACIVEVRKITLDEYKLLSKKYESHALFGIPDRSYLEFTKINNNYVFRINLFADHHKDEIFSNLAEAQEREKEIRDTVKNIVKRAVFKKDCSSEKLQMIKCNLLAIKKAKKMKTKDEMIDILTKEINEYISELKK